MHYQLLLCSTPDLCNLNILSAPFVCIEFCSRTATIALLDITFRAGFNWQPPNFPSKMCSSLGGLSALQSTSTRLKDAFRKAWKKRASLFHRRTCARRIWVPGPSQIPLNNVQSMQLQNIRHGSIHSKHCVEKIQGKERSP